MKGKMLVCGAVLCLLQVALVMSVITITLPSKEVLHEHLSSENNFGKHAVRAGIAVELVDQTMRPGEALLILSGYFFQYVDLLARSDASRAEVSRKIIQAAEEHETLRSIFLQDVPQEWKRLKAELKLSLIRKFFVELA